MAETNNRWRLQLLTHLCFTLPVSVLPVALLFLMRAYDGAYPTIPELLVNGGVLIIAVTMATEAMSRLIIGGKKWMDMKIVAGGCSVGVIITGSLFYALRYARQPTNSALFVNLCVIVLFVSVAISTFCRFLPEEDK